MHSFLGLYFQKQHKIWQEKSTDEEIIAVAKKRVVHENIMALPTV